MDTMINNAAIKNVDLKITFSRPRLLKEAEDCVQPLAKPTPRDWAKIINIKVRDNTIWDINKNVFIN